MLRPTYLFPLQLQMDMLAGNSTTFFKQQMNYDKKGTRNGIYSNISIVKNKTNLYDNM